MDSRAQAAIRDAYLAGEDLPGIAAAAGVSAAEADTYLTWWLGEYAPGADTSGTP